MTPLEQTIELDKRLVAIARDIKILSILNWPPAIGEKFLNSWRAGNPELPEPEYLETADFSEAKAALQQLISECDTTNPLQAFIQDTAKSYHTTALMVEGIGTDQFRVASEALYGKPSDCLHGAPSTHLDSAKLLIELTNDFQAAGEIPEEAVCIMPSTVQAELQQRADSVFHSHPVSIELDPAMASKAAAGATRVRLRSHSCFSPADIEQLAEHELFVHTLTAINGREQSVLQSLGLSAPRTTRTQEGIAIFSELITNAMDLSRLRRIALRVIGVDMVLSGADFIQVFTFFLENGQSEKESYQSTYRVFRGGDVRGGIGFTKDAAYLAGFTEVHTFLRKAIQQQKLHYPDMLMMGRLALSDVSRLEEAYQEGTINQPLYRPSWIENRPTLLASLLYSSFLNVIDLTSISLESFSKTT